MVESNAQQNRPKKRRWWRSVGPALITAVLFVTTSWTFVNENSSIITDFNLPSKSYFHRGVPGTNRSEQQESLEVGCSFPHLLAG